MPRSAWHPSKRFRYILFCKPFNVLSQFTDTEGRQTLKEYVNIPDIYSVGRLDYDSEGLMLLTDDARLKFLLSDPRFEHPKTYWAQVEGLPTDAAIQSLCRGVDIQDYRTRPAEVHLLEGDVSPWPRTPPIRYRANIPTSWIELTIHEGKNRQVRRMTAAVGFPTLRLIRVGIGPIRLDLLPGAYRPVKDDELKALEQMVNATNSETRVENATSRSIKGPKKGKNPNNNRIVLKKTVK